MKCPNDCGDMLLKKSTESSNFRGVDITFQMEGYVCPVCGIDVGIIDQGAATQRAIMAAYMAARKQPKRDLTF